MRSTIGVNVSLVMIVVAFTCVVGTRPTLAQGESGGKSPITPADYGKWERLGSGTLSFDGQWLAYPIIRVNEENELRVRLLRSDSTVVAPYGSRPTFSKDNRWLAYAIGVSVEEGERLEKNKQPVHNGLGLLDLVTGQRDSIAGVRDFAFSDDGAYLAMHRYPTTDKAKHRGSNLIVRTLGQRVDMTFGNVAEFAWQDQGPLLALVIDAEQQAGNGVQVFDPRDGALRVFETHDARYRGLAWRDESADLAVLRTVADSSFEDSTHVIVAWKDAADGMPQRSELDPATHPTFPLGMRVVEHRDLEWSIEGSLLFLGVQERTPVPEQADSATADDDLATVEIWHARDVEIIPEQKVRRQRLREENYLAAWHLGTNEFVQLGDEVTESINRVHGDKYALGMDRTPYDADRMFGPLYRDVYLIDVSSGEKRLVEEKVEFSTGFGAFTGAFGTSPAGQYLLYFKADDFWVYDIATGRTVNVTSALSTTFANMDNNHTIEQKPPHGIAGWTSDDRTVLIYDKHDLWEVNPDGSGGQRLTDGASQDIRFRYVRLDPDEEHIDVEQPIYLSMYNEWTEEWGYARLRCGRSPEILVWGEDRVTRLARAKDNDVYTYVLENFDDSPDYFVAGPSLADARQVTRTNPFQADYAWGRSELVSYENEWGVPLQGALFYPADYEPGRQYPMVVYFYEIVSSSARAYVVPSDRSAYNTAVYTANGYFVYRPDITYRARNPGLSAVEALRPAVATVLESGMIDPDRVGLVGHSWGGYQTAFTVTQTDIFAAAVAGAPLTNLTSMYLSVYWNTGGTDARIFEISQGRMEVPFWEDVDSYVANSPVFHVDKLNTPLLVAHGTEDGAVDYNQGVEYYNAARRAGKDFVLLVYNGENHSNRRKPNQHDYHRRILEWFGHYLKGDPAPEWIAKGLSYEEQQRLLKYGRPVKRALIP